ncbi:unnamed protein product [Brassica rapa subsp. narinosa]
MVDEKVIVNEVETRVSYRAAYVIHFLLGAGSLIPWNALITAVDYFGYLYPDKHVEKTFTVAYMSCSVLVLVLMMTWNTRLSYRLRILRDYDKSFAATDTKGAANKCSLLLHSELDHLTLLLPLLPHWLRTEVPVVVLTFMQGLTSGYLTSVLRIMAPKTVHASEAELAAVFMVVFLGIGLVCGPVLGWVWLI